MIIIIIYILDIQHKKFFLLILEHLKKYQFDIGFFETAQDSEHYNGFVFTTTSELCIPNKYQSYSFYEKGTNLIYIFNTQIINGKPSQDFGRMVGRLFIGKKGKLEGIYFMIIKIF